MPCFRVGSFLCISRSPFDCQVNRVLSGQACAWNFRFRPRRKILPRRICFGQYLGSKIKEPRTDFYIMLHFHIFCNSSLFLPVKKLNAKKVFKVKSCVFCLVMAVTHFLLNLWLIDGYYALLSVAWKKNPVRSCTYGRYSFRNNYNIIII